MKKICRLAIIAAFIFSIYLYAGLAQEISNETGDLVEVTAVCPSIIKDIRYATANNFVGKQLYETDRCFLRAKAAEKLINAQEEFRKQGLSLKVFDCYRPLSVQKKMWQIMPDPNFVADPKKGSKHNRGAAVDITLVDKNGKELDMGTGYDDFTEKAAPDYKDLPEEVLKNRALLREVMERNGFKGITSEWWHFDDTQWQDYPILDVGFCELIYKPESRATSQSLPSESARLPRTSAPLRKARE